MNICGVQLKRTLQNNISQRTGTGYVQQFQKLGGQGFVAIFLSKARLSTLLIHNPLRKVVPVRQS
jgi:hypothetical protein